MQVERGYTEGLPEVYPSGGRVSNAWVTYLIQGDNTGKSKEKSGMRMGPRPIS